MAAISSQSGALDGLTILRFAHAFQTGGGVELHLADLNRALLQRNDLTVIQMHLSLDANPQPREEAIGRGRMIRVPLHVDKSPSAPGAQPDHGGSEAAKRR